MFYFSVFLVCAGLLDVAFGSCSTKNPNNTQNALHVYNCNSGETVTALQWQNNLSYNVPGCSAPRPGGGFAARI